MMMRKCDSCGTTVPNFTDTPMGWFKVTVAPGTDYDLCVACAAMPMTFGHITISNGQPSGGATPPPVA
jgi:hypothetical protein